MAKKTNNRGIFHQLLKKITKGDESRELYFWDVCYRYEVYFCLLITILLLVLMVVSGNKNHLSYFLIILAIPWIMAMVAVSPLYEDWSNQGISIPQKRDDIGQFRFLLACVLGAVGMVALLALPFLPLYFTRDSGNNRIFVNVLVLCAVHYPIIILVYVFVRDYVKWRFDWAFKNYELLWSRHYRWWTTGLDYEVQRINLAVFRSYKIFAGTLLLAGPLCMCVRYYLFLWLGV